MLCFDVFIKAVFVSEWKKKKLDSYRVVCWRFLF